MYVFSVVERDVCGAGVLCLAVRKFGNLRSGDVVQCDMERWRGAGESLMTGGVTGDVKMIVGMIC